MLDKLGMVGIWALHSYDLTKHTKACFVFLPIISTEARLRAKRRNQGVSRMVDNAVSFCGGSPGLLGKLGMMGV